MATSPNKLTIMTFPQHWDGNAIKLNVLVLPHEDPMAPFTTNLPPGVTAKAFAEAKLKFNAMIIDNLDFLPNPSDVTNTIAFTSNPPTNALQLFKELAKKFKITKPSNVVQAAKASTFIQKYLPHSYRNSFAFSQPRTPFAKIDDSYHCAVKTKPSGLPKPIYSTDEVSWGKVFALTLRQPVLAKKLGFIYELEIPIPVGVLKDGGWLYIDLDSASDLFPQIIAQPDIVKRYAARIPALSVQRPLFAAVQFPVSAAPLIGNYDPIFVEAEDYDDGFGKIVHCMQPVSANLLLEPGQENEGAQHTRDFGIRLGWDDEQLLIWQNRQMTIDPDLGTRLDAPMGVFNYRIDVRKNGEYDTKWNSLTKVQGDLVLNSIEIGNINDELGIEVGPTQLDGQKDGIFWLPMYYTIWGGSSLIIKDEKAATLAGTDTLQSKQMSPVDAEKVPLRYGETLDFRVRFADTTGGGPNEKDVPINGGESPISTCRFRRYLPPQKVQIPNATDDSSLTATKTTCQIFRPWLGYPALVYTGLPNAYNLLLADLPTAMSEKREAFYFDPDVTSMQIDVSVKAPEMDNLASKNGKESYYHLFTTKRNFPNDITQAFNLEVEYLDANVIKFGDESDLGDLPLTTSTSKIKLPSSRDLRIQVTPVCKEDATLKYFGTQDARFGKPVTIYTRAQSKDERNLFINSSPARQFQSIFLQTDSLPTLNLAAQMTTNGQSFETPANLFQRFADQLELDTSSMTLFGKPGQRVIFGCSKGIRHTLSPEHGAITFSSKADLTHLWIPTIELELNRDWSWDALEYKSFIVKRDGVLVGEIDLQNTLSITAVKNADRMHTRIIFFDAVDPKDITGAFPKPQQLNYTIEPNFKTVPAQKDALKTLKMIVPVAVPPAQVPKVVSAGIALSPFSHTDTYSETTNRNKVLWIEFAEAVNNPDDDYFAFVKAYAPDPILVTGYIPVPDPKENIPFVPAELIRVITTGQSDDKAGINAWQRLIPCKEISPLHFIMPLPPGLYADASELFGFFVYEFCVGHARVWSTAQGRFGRPIRLTGVQHPAPQLTCTVDRNDTAIVMTAPYAAPVYNGQSLLRGEPQTEIWGVIYTQVIQADGATFRNILLSEKRMVSMRTDQQYGLAYIKQAPTLDLYGGCGWSQIEITQALENMGLPPESPLSILAIELFKNHEPVAQPIGQDLGKMRIYRTSRLVPVPEICCC